MMKKNQLKNNGKDLRKLILQQPWKDAAEIVRRENRRKYLGGMMELKQQSGMKHGECSSKIELMKLEKGGKD
jgi:hypothetical protein